MVVSLFSKLYCSLHFKFHSKETKQNQFLVLDVHVLLQKLNMFYNVKHISLYHVFSVTFRLIVQCKSNLWKRKIQDFFIKIWHLFVKNHINLNKFLTEIFNGEIGHLLVFRNHSKCLWQLFYINILTPSCRLRCTFNIYILFLIMH